MRAIELAWPCNAWILTSYRDVVDVLEAVQSLRFLSGDRISLNVSRMLEYTEWMKQRKVSTWLTSLQNFRIVKFLIILAKKT